MDLVNCVVSLVVQLTSNSLDQIDNKFPFIVVSGNTVQKCVLRSKKLVIALTLTEDVLRLLEQPLKML